jgi:hypothetical protein
MPRQEPVEFCVCGRGDWIRTSDLPVPNRTLYQAEPRPDNLRFDVSPPGHSVLRSRTECTGETLLSFCAVWIANW